MNNKAKVEIFRGEKNALSARKYQEMEWNNTSLPRRIFYKEITLF